MDEGRLIESFKNVALWFRIYCSRRDSGANNKKMLAMKDKMLAMKDKMLAIEIPYPISYRSQP